MCMTAKSGWQKRRPNEIETRGVERCAAAAILRLPMNISYACGCVEGIKISKQNTLSDDRLWSFRATSSTHCIVSLCALLMRMNARINDRTKICKRSEKKDNHGVGSEATEHKKCHRGRKKCIAKEFAWMVEIRQKGGAFKILFMGIVNRYAYNKNDRWKAV